MAGRSLCLTAPCSHGTHALPPTPPAPLHCVLHAVCVCCTVCSVTLPLVAYSDVVLPLFHCLLNGIQTGSKYLPPCPHLHLLPSPILTHLRLFLESLCSIWKKETEEGKRRGPTSFHILCLFLHVSHALTALACLLAALQLLLLQQHPLPVMCAFFQGREGLGGQVISTPEDSPSL